MASTPPSSEPTPLIESLQRFLEMGVARSKNESLTRDGLQTWNSLVRRQLQKIWGENASDMAHFASLPQQLTPAEVRRIVEERTEHLRRIIERLQSLVEDARTSGSGNSQLSRRVFIVHGHDAVLKNELARLLEKLDFVPIILHEQPDRGQTIIQKLGREITDVGFAFVVLTPDDVGAVATDPSSLKPRARQNVVFEHGLFSGRLSQSRVCAIRRGDVEIPSDLHGVVYKTVPVGGSVASIALEVVNELKAAGYVVDANRLLSL